MTIVVLFAFSALTEAACEKSPPEIVGKDPTPGGQTPATQPNHPANETPASPVTGPGNLQAALLGLPATGPVYADLQTDAGKLSCRLFEDKAPTTVANFVGLARGIQSFQDPMTGKWVKRPAYDGTTFHRIIKGFMIQGGDPKGEGNGEPGYVVQDEIWPGSKHDRAGLLCMANRGPNTNGMQFFITDASAPHLDGNYTIFGECAPLEIVHKLGATPVSGERPVNKPTISRVTIRRG